MVLPDVQSYDMSFYNNFNYNLLMAPSFANGENLFVLPIVDNFLFVQRRTHRNFSHKIK